MYLFIFIRAVLTARVLAIWSFLMENVAELSKRTSVGERWGKAGHLMQEAFRSFPMNKAWNLLDTSQAVLFTRICAYRIERKASEGWSESHTATGTAVYFCLIRPHTLKAELGRASEKPLLLLPVSLTKTHLPWKNKQTNKQKRGAEMSFADIVIPCCPGNKYNIFLSPWEHLPWSKVRNLRYSRNSEVCRNEQVSNPEFNVVYPHKYSPFDFYFLFSLRYKHT